MNKTWKLANQYLVVKKIGKGGFATVYKAVDLTLRKFVAVKKVREEYTKDAKITDMFMKEAINTAKLEHENIVKVINFTKEEDNYYIILDYVSGVDLEYLIKKSRACKTAIPGNLAAYIMSETLRALDYAHTYKDELTGKVKRFIHYDVSPGNIMLYFDGRVKLTDFGIAKAGGTAKKGVRGKISYVSPEQVRGNKAAQPSDLFSAGLVFYEMLTGTKAYKGDTGQKLQQAKNAKIDFTVFEKKKVPETLSGIVKKLLKKDPEKRYSSAKECLSDLDRFLSDKKNIDELKQEFKGFLAKLLKKEIEIYENEIKREAEVLKETGEDVSGAVIKSPQPEPVKSSEPEPEKAPEPEPEKTPEPEPEKAPEPEPEKPLGPEEVSEDEDKIDPVVITPGEDQEPVFEPEPDKPLREEEVPEPAKASSGGEPAKGDSLPSSFRVKEEGEDDISFGSDEKEKTVIDFVLDTAKKYRKIFITLVVSLVTALLIFTAIDTQLQMTPLGIKVSNLIWPPALSLDTFPSGARIRIYDANMTDIIQRDGYRRVTPTYIERIPPGTYTMRVSLGDFGEMTRVISVLERETGEQQITIAGAAVRDGVHIVPFEVRVAVDSEPSGAVLMVDGRNVGRTPFSGDFEIGEHSLMLIKDGFEELGFRESPRSLRTGVCVIDTSRQADEQRLVDRQFWEVGEDRHEGRRRLRLTGRPWRYLDLISDPEGATVFISDYETGDMQEIGETPINDFKVTVGEYDLRFEKDGYQTWEGSLEIDAETEEVKQVELKKFVTVRAVQRGTGRTVNADVVISAPEIETIRGQTPLDVALPLEEVRFSLSREPSYEPVNVTRDVRRLRDTFTLQMSLRRPHLTVNVRDYTTGSGIGEATVWINGNYWQRTNTSGVAGGFIDEPPGEYEIEVRAEEYEGRRSRVTVYRGQRRRLDIKLGAPRDGTVKLDIPEGYEIEKVLINDEPSEVTDDNIIKEVPRGSHHIAIEFKEPERQGSGSISLTQPEEIVVLRVSERRDRLHFQTLRPPGLRVRVRDYDDKKPIPGVHIWLDGNLLGTVGEDGVYSTHVLEPEGDYILRITGEDIEDTRSAVTLENDTTREYNVELNPPSDGALIIDIPDDVYDAEVYVNGQFKGENVRLISDIPRTRSLVEVRSRALRDETSKVIELTEENTLVVLRLSRTDAGLVLGEVDPRGYLR